MRFYAGKIPSKCRTLPFRDFPEKNTVGWSDWIICIEGLIMKACDSVQKVSSDLCVSVREHF